MEQDYFSQRDEKNIRKIREVVDSLPRFVNEFFVGINTRTSALTRLGYAYDLRIFFDYISQRLKKPVAEITLKDIAGLEAFDLELYLEYLSSYTFGGKKYRCGEQSKERKLSSLRSFFKYYFKKDKLERDVAAKVDMPKTHDKPIVRLEPNEVAELLDKIDSPDSVEGLTKRQNDYHAKTRIRDTAIISLFLGTGIRISELVGLNVKDIDFESNSFCVTRKGGNQSILYFPDEVSAALMKYLEFIQDEIDNKTLFGVKIKESQAADTAPLFLSLQGTRITVRAVENLVKKYSRLVTPLKKITPHKLRSTFGTELYRNTHDIYVVADVLGHKDINTTKKHYAALSEDIRKNAAKTVKLRDKD